MKVLIKYYDLIKPTRCLVEEKQRYLKIQQEDENRLCSLLYH